MRRIPCLVASVAAFLRFSLYCVPPFTEMLLMGVNGRGSPIAGYTIFVYSFIINALAFVAGARLIYESMMLNCERPPGERSNCCCGCYCSEEAREFWCASLIKIESIWSGMNLAIIATVYWLVNAILSWVDAPYLTWWMHILCYTPLAMGTLGMFMGYAWNKTCQGGYEKIPA